MTDTTMTPAGVPDRTTGAAVTHILTAIEFLVCASRALNLNYPTSDRNNVRDPLAWAEASLAKARELITGQETA